MTSFVAALLPALAEFDPLNPDKGGEIFWTWVIFLLALPVIWKFIFGPITRALAERDFRAESAVRRAEEAREAAEAASRRTQEDLERARAEAARTAAEARAAAERQARGMVEEARREAQRSLEKARAEIEMEKLRALSEIRDEVVELSVAMASRLLRRDVDDEAHRAFVREMLAGVRASGGRN